MQKVVYVWRVLYALSFLLSGCATTQTPNLSTPSLSSAPGPDLLTLPPFAQIESKPLSPALATKSFSLDLGLQVVKLQTSFVEKKENPDALKGVLEEGLSRRYLNFLATSSSPSSGLLTEGEFSYNPSDSLKAQCDCGEEPRMLRLSMKDQWAGLTLGADYRSIGKGFTFVTGEKVDQSRDEGRLWGERNFGPFNLRGSIGQSWERLSDTDQFRLTKTASTGLNFNRAEWGGGWISSFSMMGPNADASHDTAVYSQTLSGAYRPVAGLSLGSNLTMKQERNISTGFRTDTPGAGLTLSYTPSRNRFTLTGSTGYTRSFSGSSNVEKVDLMAGINWKLGRFLATDDVLSFNLKYNRQLDYALPGASHDDLSGMFQLKVLGF
jgi:hypothetical protein